MITKFKLRCLYKTTMNSYCKGSYYGNSTLQFHYKSDSNKTKPTFPIQWDQLAFVKTGSNLLLLEKIKPESDNRLILDFLFLDEIKIIELICVGDSQNNYYKFFEELNNPSE